MEPLTTLYFLIEAAACRPHCWLEKRRLVGWWISERHNGDLGVPLSLIEGAVTGMDPIELYDGGIVGSGLCVLVVVDYGQGLSVHVGGWART